MQTRVRISKELAESWTTREVLQASENHLEDRGECWWNRRDGRYVKDMYIDDIITWWLIPLSKWVINQL
jgi:hypothetical protein